MASTIDRPEFGSVVALCSHGRLFRLTPYWRIGCLARHPVALSVWHAMLPLAKHRQPPPWAVAVLLVGAPPYAGFVLWMLQRAGDVATADLWWRMWLAGLWILVSPGLIVAWERRFVQLHSVLMARAVEEGWHVSRLVSVDRIFAKLWWPFVGLAGAAMLGGYLTGIDFLQQRLGAARPPDPYFWLGLVLVAMMGVSFGVGVWGVAKTLVYAWVALDSEITLDPFRPKPPDGFEELSSFTYWTGLLYSIGSISLPGTYAILGELPPVGQVIGVMFAGCLLFGGAAVFVLPSLWMSRLSRDMKVAALDRYTAVLHQLDAAVFTPPAAAGKGGGVDLARLAEQVAAVTSLRALIAAEQRAPSALWVGARTFAIFIMPVVISAVQTATGIS